MSRLGLLQQQEKQVPREVTGFRLAALKQS